MKMSIEGTVVEMNDEDLSVVPVVDASQIIQLLSNAQNGPSEGTASDVSAGMTKK